ncbi:MAG: hypothetical protein EOL93_01700, partial [Epsilonproteobacteria bacterium]|nr:hypothetical protein [Campylobacterota bacterium]
MFTATDKTIKILQVASKINNRDMFDLVADLVEKEFGHQYNLINNGASRSTEDWARDFKLIKDKQTSLDLMRFSLLSSTREELDKYLNATCPTKKPKAEAKSGICDVTYATITKYGNDKVRVDIRVPDQVRKLKQRFLFFDLYDVVSGRKITSNRCSVYHSASPHKILQLSSNKCKFFDDFIVSGNESIQAGIAFYSSGVGVTFDLSDDSWRLKISGNTLRSGFVMPYQIGNRFGLSSKDKISLDIYGIGKHDLIGENVKSSVRLYQSSSNHFCTTIGDEWAEIKDLISLSK